MGDCAQIMTWWRTSTAKYLSIGAAAALAIGSPDLPPVDTYGASAQTRDTDPRGWPFVRGCMSDLRIDACTKIINSGNRHLRPTAYLFRGIEYLKTNSFDKAISDFTNLINLQPDNVYALTLRGKAYGGKRQHDRALADYNTAIRYNPVYAPAVSSRGVTYEHINRPELAIADFQAALTIPISSADGIQQSYEFSQAHSVARARLAALAAGEQAQAAASTQLSTEPFRLETRRIALVIGNSVYSHAPRLTNPASDVKAVAAAFRRLGFAEVVEQYDLGAQQLREALKSFGDQAAGADWAVVYFAGHGIQVNRTSYLIPTDAKLVRATHVEDEAVALPYVLAKVEDARQLRLVILDACRNNPFLTRMEQTAATRSLGRGLGHIEPQRGVLVAYAARDGQLAEDGPDGNSPFTRALLEHLEEPGLEIGLLFRKVRDAVLRRTSNAQEPFVYGSLPSEGLYFKAPR